MARVSGTLKEVLEATDVLIEAFLFSVNRIRYGHPIPKMDAEKAQFRTAINHMIDARNMWINLHMSDFKNEIMLMYHQASDEMHELLYEMEELRGEKINIENRDSEYWGDLTLVHDMAEAIAGGHTRFLDEVERVIDEYRNDGENLRKESDFMISVLTNFLDDFATFVKIWGMPE